MNQSRRPLLGRAVNAAAGALQQHVLQQNKAAELLKSSAAQSSPSVRGDDEQYAGIVFSGNPHETVPRRLLLDDRLSPLERNAWQVFRLLINSDGLTAFPTYEQLRPYLGSEPSTPASRETIAKTLTKLRLTRWLSLGRRVRDSLSGRVQGNVYILHDEPIGCAEAMEIDRDYMLLIGQSLEHANRSVRLLAERAFNDVASDTNLQTSTLPSRLEVMEERLSYRDIADHLPPTTALEAEFGIRTQIIENTEHPSSDSELSGLESKASLGNPSSESELRQKLADLVSVRNPNSYSTYTNTNTSVSKSSVLREQEPSGLLVPDQFRRMSQEQQQRATTALSMLETHVQQSVLIQWGHRVSTGTVKNSFGYLLSCVQRAMKGEFNTQWRAPSVQDSGSAVASTSASQVRPDISQTGRRVPEPSSSSAGSAQPARPEASLENGRSHMLSIRQMVAPRMPKP
ncbi:STY4528 family pathogenicity island replication protein [Pseudomonas sp. NPDC088368]|uniref:STY4528 family pathogenicity island replication protein n=1 Tax=Pseudomonas sp. NPDC088368 TaxID=3364453 RepID=UPI0038298F18